MKTPFYLFPIYFPYIDNIFAISSFVFCGKLRSYLFYPYGMGPLSLVYGSHSGACGSNHRLIIVFCLYVMIMEYNRADPAAAGRLFFFKELRA